MLHSCTEENLTNSEICNWLETYEDLLNDDDTEAINEHHDSHNEKADVNNPTKTVKYDEAVKSVCV